ncbi:hypothetical protein [Aeromicrobium wangtongii]|uniref:Carboxypeptidase regulatory-like domain-containing protein n=1 Tax=Aeromicrobium wangtongii TaxID=2969247 RepID=A0ABY5M9E4_9ACTN|nr:hypothetical protein [Aeromicrobium wangtongii]MCD9199998.1 hypothetical protein [Aeromicrobium wangtongii]UUP13615.1 hypothetical protein NQV15_17470 [Aeromicrobium wangtongii]
MRKTLVLLIASVVVLGLVSPAEAAKKSGKKSFSVSLSPKPTGTQKKYNDTSLDLSSRHAPVNTRTTIRGKVKGGKVKGKKVAIYVTNMNTQARKRTFLGSAKIGKGGYFTKRFAPSKGHAGRYKIQIVKKAGSGRRAKTKTFYIRVYEWVSLSRFYDAAASTPGLARADKEPVGSRTNERWSVSYALPGASTAVFNPAGYGCVRFNLKLGVSTASRVDAAAYTVAQPGRLLMAGTKTRGGGFDEPSRATSERIDPNLPLTVSNVGDPGSRLILGLPKMACLRPYKVAPAPR